MKTIEICGKSFKIHEGVNGRKIIYHDDELTTEESVRLIFNGYTVMPTSIKNDITAKCIETEMKLTWGDNHPLRKYLK
jgi:hypothetical protein